MLIGDRATNPAFSPIFDLPETETPTFKHEYLDSP